jgi:hypothetical protein
VVGVAQAVFVGEAAPRCVHGEDGAFAVEHGDVRRQGVEQCGLLGGITLTQLFGGSAQQEDAAGLVGHRVDLAGRQ